MFSEDMTKNWNQKKANRRGRPVIYSNEVILIMLEFKAEFSIIEILGLKLKIPYYSQISRRAKKLGKEVNRLTRKNVTDIVFDSSGLKVYGEGEWKVKVHGKSKRRT